MDTKRVKRKLVFELGTGCKQQKDLPAEYSKSKLEWQCDVVIEGRDHIVNEYTIVPNSKIYLNEFLNNVKEEINDIAGDSDSDWGIKLYRVTSKKR